MARTLALRRGDFWLKVATGLTFVVVADQVLLHIRVSSIGWVLVVLPLLAVITRPVLRRDWRALVCFCLATLMALGNFADPSWLAWSLFWVFAGMGALMPGVGQFGDAWQWGQRLAWFAVRSCIAPLLDLRRVIKARRGRGQLRRHLPHLVLPALGSWTILTLFAQANPMIGIGLDNAFDAMFPGFAAERLSFVWPTLLTFGWCLLRPRARPRVLATFDGSSSREIPGFTVQSVRLSLIAFNALFAMQNLMDLAWLWRLAPLPKGMTLAGYAHRAADPLIVTALLAAGFVLVALRPGSQTAAVPWIRRLVVLWVAQNVLLVGNAALRTVDYIAASSLTALRISALLWMGLVALGLVLVLWRVLFDKSASWLINANAAAALGLLMGCCVVDLDTVAARYNIAHARELGGGGAPLDICYLQAMGPSALLPLAELEQRRTPPLIHVWAQWLRENDQRTLIWSQGHIQWTWLGARRLAAVPEALHLHALPGDASLYPDCRERNIHVLRIALGLSLIHI